MITLAHFLNLTLSIFGQRIFCWRGAVLHVVCTSLAWQPQITPVENNCFLCIRLSKIPAGLSPLFLQYFTLWTVNAGGGTSWVSNMKKAPECLHILHSAYLLEQLTFLCQANGAQRWWGQSLCRSSVWRRLLLCGLAKPSVTEWVASWVLEGSSGEEHSWQVRCKCYFPSP